VQSAEDDANPFSMGKLNVGGDWSPKVMNEVAGLRVIPPPQEVNLHSNIVQSTPGLLDLNLKATMREQERSGMVEQDFHVLATMQDALGFKPELFASQWPRRAASVVRTFPYGVRANTSNSSFTSSIFEPTLPPVVYSFVEFLKASRNSAPLEISIQVSKMLYR